ncbi:MAG: (d)CMP kinase [candidate division WOR-3 bacterium]|nr:(d)CMP kinase [candidate division WOR-3 bacterium]
MVVTIDGTSASGKSTTAKEVARKLGFIYIDTGAMYRAVALYCIENRINIHDRKAVADVSREINIRFVRQLTDWLDENRIFLNGREVTNLIRTEEVGSVASTVAAYKDVRSNLVEKQRKMGRKENVICEGRDIGTVVFKDADVKIYMDADLIERARRRQRELERTADLQSVIESLKKRDEQDKTRAESPLKIPEDAVIIDTTHLSIEDEVEKVIEVIRNAK